MTIIAALQFNGKTVIGSDSCWSTETTRTLNVKNRTKLFKFDGFVVGVCGLFTVVHAIEVLQKRKKPFKMKNINHARQFVTSLYEVLKQEYDNSPAAGEKSDFSPILIATPKKLFICDQYGCAMEYDKFCAIGSGEETAIGSLAALYEFLPKGTDPYCNCSCPMGYELEGQFHLETKQVTVPVLRDMLTTVLYIVCSRSLSCFPPIEVIEVV